MTSRRALRKTATLVATFVAFVLGALTASRAANAQTAPATDVEGNPVDFMRVLTGNPYLESGTFPSFTQSNGGWCFVTTAQMVLAYYGATVPQCELVDQCRVTGTGASQETHCGGSNVISGCCPDGASNGACDGDGGSTLPILGYYQFTYENDENISLDQLESEIDGGRPVIVAFRGTWGGHVMVVSGYGTNRHGESLLLVNDPDARSGSTMPTGAYGLPGKNPPGFVCPASQNPCWITMRQYECACDSNGTGSCGCNSSGEGCWGGRSPQCAGPPHWLEWETWNIRPYVWNRDPP